MAEDRQWPRIMWGSTDMVARALDLSGQATRSASGKRATRHNVALMPLLKTNSKDGLATTRGSR